MANNPVKISEVIGGVEDRFYEIAPAAMKFAAEQGFAVQLLNNNSYLHQVAIDCPTSLQQAIHNVAAIGLSLNPAEKLAYLIPRNIKVSKGQYETRVFLEPSYMGMIRLATDTGAIKWVQAAAVYSNDCFVDNGVGERPTHNCNPFDTVSDRGEFSGVYCVAKTIDGDFLTTILAAETIYDIRGRSETYKKYQSGVWVTDFIEMAKKSAVRRAFKTWPRTDNARMLRLAEAVEISNNNEGFEPILTEPNFEPATGTQKQYFDQMIESQNAIGLFVFYKSLDIPIQVNLINSFPKGKKGQFQDITQGLLVQGESMIKQYRESLEEATQINDDAEIERLVNEMTNDELEFVLQTVPADVKSLVSGFKGD